MHSLYQITLLLNIVLGSSYLLNLPYDKHTPLYVTPEMISLDSQHTEVGAPTNKVKVYTICWSGYMFL